MTVNTISYLKEKQWEDSKSFSSILARLKVELMKQDFSAITLSHISGCNEIYHICKGFGILKEWEATWTPKTTHWPMYRPTYPRALQGDTQFAPLDGRKNSFHHQTLKWIKGKSLGTKVAPEERSGQWPTFECHRVFYSKRKIMKWERFLNWLWYQRDLKISRTC